MFLRQLDDDEGGERALREFDGIRERGVGNVQGRHLIDGRVLVGADHLFEKMFMRVVSAVAVEWLS